MYEMHNYDIKATLFAKIIGGLFVLIYYRFGLFYPIIAALEVVSLFNLLQ